MKPKVGSTLNGLRPLRSLVTPTAETTISFMKGADRFGSGTWLCYATMSSAVPVFTKVGTRRGSKLTVPQHNPQHLKSSGTDTLKYLLHFSETNS